MKIKFGYVATPYGVERTEMQNKKEENMQVESLGIESALYDRFASQYSLTPQKVKIIFKTVLSSKDAIRDAEEIHNFFSKVSDSKKVVGNADGQDLFDKFGGVLNEDGTLSFFDSDGKDHKVKDSSSLSIPRKRNSKWFIVGDKIVYSAKEAAKAFELNGWKDVCPDALQRQPDNGFGVVIDCIPYLSKKFLQAKRKVANSETVKKEVEVTKDNRHTCTPICERYAASKKTPLADYPIGITTEEFDKIYDLASETDIKLEPRVNKFSIILQKKENMEKLQFILSTINDIDNEIEGRFNPEDMSGEFNLVFDEKDSAYVGSDFRRILQTIYEDKGINLSINDIGRMDSFDDNAELNIYWSID